MNSRQRRHPLRALAVMGVLALSCRAEPAPEQAGLLRALSLLDAKDRAALAGDPQLLQRIVQLTHAQQLLLNEAREKKWEERPEVKARLERARNTALAESWLEFVAEPPPGFPGEEEIKTAWEQRKASFATPRQFRLAQIFVACPRGAPADVEKRAKAKLARVRSRLDSPTDDFATVARAESEDTASAANGGEIGWLSDAQIQPELRAPIVRLRIHGISEPVRLNDGWHILKCLDRREARTPSLEDARATLVIQLRAEKTKADSEAHVARLLKAHPLQVEMQEVADVLKESAAAREK